MFELVKEGVVAVRTKGMLRSEMVTGKRFPYIYTKPVIHRVPFRGLEKVERAISRGH